MYISAPTITISSLLSALETLSDAPATIADPQEIGSLTNVQPRHSGAYHTGGTLAAVMVLVGVHLAPSQSYYHVLTLLLCKVIITC